MIKQIYYHEIWEDDYHNEIYAEFVSGNLQLKNGKLSYNDSIYLKDWPIKFLGALATSRSAIDIYYDINLDKICARLEVTTSKSCQIYKIEDEQLTGFIPKYLFAQKLLYGKWFIRKKYNTVLYTPKYTTVAGNTYDKLYHFLLQFLMKNIEFCYQVHLNILLI